MPKRAKRAKVNDEPIILVDNPMKAKHAMPGQTWRDNGHKALIKKNGALLGVAVTSGLSGDLCWAITCLQPGDSLRIKAVDPEDF